MSANSIVIERQINFYCTKKYAQHFLFQPFFITLAFSHLKHRNYVSSMMRVSALQGSGASVGPVYCSGKAQNYARSLPLKQKVQAKLIISFEVCLTVQLLIKLQVYLLAIK